MPKSLSIFFTVLFAGAVILSSCVRRSEKGSESPASRSFDEISITHAKNFSVQVKEPGVLHLRICNVENGGGATYDYLLVQEGYHPSDSLMLMARQGGFTRLNLPLRSFICMTSLQLAGFIAIDATVYVKGITSTRHLFDERIKAQLSDGITQQIGIEGNFDSEMVMAVNPDLILISPSKRGGFDVLTESGIPVLPHLGYQELTPLGQAEWVKLIGLLTGRTAEASSYFQKVETEYERLKQLVAACEGLERPTIMSGDTKGGAWYATGGRSFLAQVFSDAGARYFMADDNHTGGVNLDFEMVYSQGADADFWRVSNSFDGQFTYDDLVAQDSRFRDFRSLLQRQVVYCNMAQRPFYESFPVHPDWLLADFIHAFHPDLLPQYEPHYYSILK